ncbi:YqgE/AlgH family protein [Deinococcus psychrotolerans]|uniref:YqgE/AlgH family protein n=1 Tax=Deinococcus psychrotolerans TaxID=2489213 RepID=A0A3G8YBL6_9DEIO|nr:YqgE/AlgH family protein [Deinococcus psychrotolerans]AZI42762.1 YqgE/AlgH family protein [Deinococcus psychrotolerans]
MTLTLLVATPQLRGSVFERGVLLMLDEQNGALGVMLNQPSGVRIGELLPEAGPSAAFLPAYNGGPVERSAGWCLYTQPTGQLQEHQLADGLWLSRDRDVLAELLSGDQAFYLLLGYAGWAPGQLKREEQEGSWLWGEVSAEDLAELLWRTSDEAKWDAALKLLGTPPENVVGGAQA